MEPLQDWRSPHFEDDLSRLDRGGVSFEFLRRNRKYRQDYADTVTRAAANGIATGEAMRRFVQRWGLVFPCRPRCPR